MYLRFIGHRLKSVDTAMRAESGGNTGVYIFTNIHIKLRQVCNVTYGHKFQL